MRVTFVRTEAPPAAGFDPLTRGVLAGFPTARRAPDGSWSVSARGDWLSLRVTPSPDGAVAECEAGESTLHVLSRLVRALAPRGFVADVPIGPQPDPEH